MRALLLLAFSWLPFGHGPRVKAPSQPVDRPLFVGEMEHLIPQRELPWQPRETAAPALDDAGTRLYVGTSDGKVRCRFEGRDAWIFRTVGSILASPTIDGETLYVSSADGNLYAVNRFTGEQRWKLDVHEELTTPPTVIDDRVFVMSSEESVTAVSAKDGKSLWKFHRDAPGGFTIRGNARPVVARGVVYAGFADGTVAALQPADGSARWTRTVSGTGDYLDVDAIAAPADEARIYVASAKIGVQALEAETGEPAWAKAFDLPGANHVLVDGPRVIASGRGLIAALSRQSGELLWKLPLERERFTTEAQVVNGLVLVAEDRGALLAIDARTGQVRQGFDPGSGFSSPVTAVPGAAFIVSNGGSLFSLGLLP